MAEKKAMKCRIGCTFRTEKGKLRGFEKDQIVKSESNLKMIEGSPYFVEEKSSKSKK